MSRSFGTFKESIESGNYIRQKTKKTSFCDSRNCYPKRNFSSQEQLLAVRNINICSTFNKANLGINLLTKLDLEKVCVIQNNITKECPTGITINGMPYLNYLIDPSGQLFGNSECGTLNYTHYMVYNPPPNPNQNINLII